MKHFGKEMMLMKLMLILTYLLNINE